MYKYEILKKRIIEELKAEKRAHSIVQNFVLSDIILLDTLINQINFIMPHHYDDIVEERSISELCGLVICSNKNVVDKYKKMSISFENKTIYDVSVRKKFCCHSCFNKSEFIKKNIPMTPLTKRKTQIANLTEVIEFLK